MKCGRNFAETCELFNGLYDNVRRVTRLTVNGSIKKCKETSSAHNEHRSGGHRTAASAFREQEILEKAIHRPQYIVRQLAQGCVVSCNPVGHVMREPDIGHFSEFQAQEMQCINFIVRESFRSWFLTGRDTLLTLLTDEADLCLLESSR